MSDFESLEQMLKDDLSRISSTPRDQISSLDIVDLKDLQVQVSLRASNTNQRNRAKDFRNQIHAIERSILMDKGIAPSALLLSNQSEAMEMNQRSLARLEQAAQDLKDCEELAQNIISELGTQEETMQRVKSNNRQVQEELDHSGSLLSKMMRWWRR